MKRLFSAAILATGLLVSQGARAEVIAECTSSKGYTYFYPGPYVKESDRGFSEDATSKGSTSIVTIGDKIDVIFTDATGSTQSSLSQGATIITVGGVPDEGRLVVLVNYPDSTVEIYSYHAMSKTLTHLQHRYKALITSSKLMVASCK